MVFSGSTALRCCHIESLVFFGQRLGSDLYFPCGQDATAELPYSRAVTFRLDLRTRTATLIASDDQPEGLSASSQGDAQPLPGGGRLVGWGAQPYVAQFDASGRLVFDAELPTGTISYRAYRLPWNAQG